MIFAQVSSNSSILFGQVYYFSLAGGVWLVILTYTWAVFFTSNSKVKGEPFLLTMNG